LISDLHQARGASIRICFIAAWRTGLMTRAGLTLQDRRQSIPLSACPHAFPSPNDPVPKDD
jgi:hypothetical protein